MPLTPRITSTGPLEWVNSHGNITAHVARLFDLRNPLVAGNQSTIEAYNAMTLALQELVAQIKSLAFTLGNGEPFVGWTASYNQTADDDRSRRLGQSASRNVFTASPPM